MNQWQRAFVIHSRPYSESSLLLDIFTEHHGRVTVLAKGARRKKSPQKGHLQLFTPLIVQYSGKGSVKTLRQVESLALTIPLYRTALYSAFYLNELLQRSVVTDNDTGQLFLAYVEALQLLASGQKSPAYALRRFELALLEYLGYSVDFLHSYGSDEEVADEMTYQYRAEKGFVASLIQSHNSFTGAELKALAARDFPDEQTLKAARRFTQMALKPYIGSQPFKSRELFRKH